MEIKRRNISETKYAITVLALILAPILIILQLNLLNGEVVYISLFVFFYAILYFFVNRDKLKKEEINYLEDKAQFKMEHNNNELQNYLFFLLVPVSQYLYLDYTQNRNLFMINTLLFIGIAVFTGYRYLSGKHYSSEKLLITESKFVFLGSRHIVIDLEDIEEAKMIEKRLRIKDKYGKSTIDLNNLKSQEINELKNQIKNLEAKR